MPRHGVISIGWKLSILEHFKKERKVHIQMRECEWYKILSFKYVVCAYISKHAYISKLFWDKWNDIFSSLVSSAALQKHFACDFISNHAYISIFLNNDAYISIFMKFKINQKWAYWYPQSEASPYAYICKMAYTSIFLSVSTNDVLLHLYRQLPYKIIFGVLL